MNVNLFELTPESVKALKGQVVTGDYKRPNKDGVEALQLEVSDLAAIPTVRGTKLYLFGTRLDAGNEGAVNCIRLDGFIGVGDTLGEVTVEPVADFTPIDATRYYVTPNSEHFAWLEEVADPKFAAYAKASGGKPLAQYIVA